MSEYRESPISDDNLICTIRDCGKSVERVIGVTGAIPTLWQGYKIIRSATGASVDRIELAKTKLLQFVGQYHHPDPEALLQLAEWMESVPMAFSQDSPVNFEVCEDHVQLVRRAFRNSAEGSSRSMTVD